MEREETVENDEAKEEIKEGSDGVMVDSGDLGVEIGDDELVGVKKKSIERNRQNKKVVKKEKKMME